MSGNIDILTLIALLVTVFVVIKLRGALGRRTPDEDQARYERQAKAREAREAAAGDKVVTLPRRQQERADDAGHQDGETEKTVEERITLRGATVIESTRDDLRRIAEHDKSFDAEHFLNGAKQAYEMIVTAFAEGNRDMLQNLLSQDVYEGFADAMDDRDSRGEKVDQSFVGINKCDITDAVLDGSEVSVTLKFVSQLITATMNSAGEVISGDPQKIHEMTDIWTFARDTRDQDPNWRLIATQASH
jgi:predicted lipid-binding transport protein (Tim44 family)